MSDERELRLGELMADALAAFAEGRTADVDRVLDEAGADRAELVDMIELALTLRGPATPSADQIAQTAAQPAFAPQAWPEILQDARVGQGLQRSTVIERVAGSLGLTSAAAQAQLRRRYHELESGLVDPSGVTDALLDALGDALGGIRSTLERTRLVPLGPLGPSYSFMRDGFDDLAEIAESEMVAHSAAPPVPNDDERAVDALFGL